MAVDALARALAAGKVPVTAYEMAVKAGYTGTEEQFAQDMGNSGTNAANAAASASAAAASAESVGASAAQIATNTSDISDLKTQFEYYLNLPANLIDGVALTSGRLILSTNGVTGSSSICDASDYIDITGISEIVYPRLSLISTTDSSGIAFYDEQKKYISGVRCIRGAETNGSVLDIASVPTDAKYVRLSLIKSDPKYLYNAVEYANSLSGKIDTVEDDIVHLNGDIALLGNAIDASQSLITRPTTLNYTIGTIALSNGSNTSSTTKCRTNYFTIKNLYVNDVPVDVMVSLRFYHYDFDTNMYVYDSGTDWLYSRTEVQNAIDSSESTILRVVFGYTDNRDITGTTDFSHFTGIIVYRYNQYENQDIPFYRKGTITDPSSSTYHKTQNFLLKKGDTVHYSVWMRGRYAAMQVYAVDGTVIFERVGVIGATTHFDETYTATNDFEYICLTTMMATNGYFVAEGYAYIESSLDKKIEDAIKQSIVNDMAERKPLAILCAKELRYSDGTHPSIEFYVLADSDNNIYISYDLVEKQKIFTFDGNISRYKFGVRKNNDIIAVYRNEFDTVTAEYGPSLDDIRQNPYVFIASEGYAVQHEVDFGTFNPDTQAGLKPTAWLENVGFCSLPNGDIIFVEYTREGVVYTANCWKIGASSNIKDPANWLIKKQFLVAQNDSLGLDEHYIEHFHAVQHDPYTDTVYITTGDLGRKSQIFYSTDSGETFTRQSFVDPATGNTVISGQKLFRLLNINFTENDVYWSSDSSSEHVVIHCERSESGGLKPDSISVLATLPNLPGTPATYGTVYFEELNALIMMESCDTAYTEMAFRAFDLTDNTVKTICTIKSAGGANVRLGFRSEYTEFDPIDGVIKIGYGYNDRYTNRNAICGNTGTNTYVNNVSNLNIRIFEKADGSFIAKFGCYYI